MAKRQRSTGPDGHAPDGWLLVDKPAGMTSRDLLNRLQRLGGVRGLGHAGTLDPFATGLLVVLIGSGSRLAPLLGERTKVYHATLRLGEETTTLDPEGEVVERTAVPPLTAERIADELAAMVGPFQYRPPKFSAIRLGGERLYDLARQGLDVQAPERVNQIHRLELLGFNPPDEITFRAEVEGGTYIRSLGAALARRLGTVGSLTALRREQVGPLLVDQAVGGAGLDNWPVGAILRGLECVKALSLPVLALPPESLSRLCHGQAIVLPRDPKLVGTSDLRRDEGIAAVTDEHQSELFAMVRWRQEDASEQVLHQPVTVFQPSKPPVPGGRA